MNRHWRMAAGIVWALGAAQAAAEPLKYVEVEFQPLVSQAQRIVKALDYLGEPIQSADARKIDELARSTDHKQATQEIQKVLDKYALVGVGINPESRVHSYAGEAPRELIQQGWRNFLVKVHNEAGVTAELKATSPNAMPPYKRSSGSAEPRLDIKEGDVPHRFLDVMMFNGEPLAKRLSGLAVEYRIVQLFCRDIGKREATLGFNVGQGTQDIGFRNEVGLLFDSKPATEVVLGVADHDGKPVMASFVIRDKFGRVYPSQARRMAPDLFFHPQVYRKDGESVHLPPGEYTVEYTRGPEYRVDRKSFQVGHSVSQREDFKLRRWIEPKKMGWWSGDHHVHAAGCAHYENPTQGVTPGDMFRHILGEDLNVGCVLSWGPCWYFQKQFFDGKVHDLSLPDYIMRYDIEVSGFPSSHTGHLCLLNLKEDDYPGTTRIEQWPSWDLPVLKWGKDQGGVVGFSHSGWGLDVKSEKLPNYLIPPYSGIGANEYIVDVVHGVCDFISAVDTPIVWELNIWYHTLNCGYRCRISGETDFPCIYGDRVGLGRVYAKVDGKLTFDKWVAGIKAGRSYCTDGLSHLIDFKVNDVALGENESQLDLSVPGKVTVTAKAATWLDEQSRPEIRARKLEQKPYWHAERARVPGTRKVPVEVIVNGYPAATKEIEADGSLQDVSFEVPLERSSWVALRVFPSAHTNPVFVHVGGKPIRASKRSAQWCIDGVDQCWNSKMPKIRETERAAAKAAFDKAREAYRGILAESFDDSGSK